MASGPVPTRPATELPDEGLVVENMSPGRFRNAAAGSAMNHDDGRASHGK